LHDNLSNPYGLFGRENKIGREEQEKNRLILFILLRNEKGVNIIFM